MDRVVLPINTAAIRLSALPNVHAMYSYCRQLAAALSECLLFQTAPGPGRRRPNSEETKCMGFFSLLHILNAAFRLPK